MKYDEVIENMCACSIGEVMSHLRAKAESNDVRVRRTLESLLIVCPTITDTVSELCKIYEQILLENYVLSERGEITYLHLPYPEPGCSEFDMKKFLYTPQLAAAVINSFKGVLVIDFYNYESSEQLIDSQYYQDFLHYIAAYCNSEIYYVFVVHPELINIDLFENSISAYKRLIRVEIPGDENLLLRRLREDGFQLTNDAQKELRGWHEKNSRVIEKNSTEICQMIEYIFVEEVLITNPAGVISGEFLRKIKNVVLPDVSETTKKGKKIRQQIGFMI